jgi:hypothetical protein
MPTGGHEREEGETSIYAWRLPPNAARADPNDVSRLQLGLARVLDEAPLRARRNELTRRVALRFRAPRLRATSAEP